jgi:predicted dehydrogenase
MRMGICGSGEVILEYVYPALKELEEKGIIKLTSIIEKCGLGERIKKLEMRAEKYPLEKESCNDIISRLKKTEKENDSIRYIEYNGQGLPNNLRDYVDFIYLATPTNVRSELIEKFAEQGVSVAIEKPIARTRGEINEVLDIIRTRNIKAICTEHYSYKAPSLALFENFYEKTRKFKKINSIEAVLEENDFLESERYAWLLDPSINGGGVWLDTGVHMMHLLYMVGAKMTDVISAKSYKYQFPTGDKRNEFIKSETAADVFLDIDGNDGRVAPNAFAHIRLGKCMPKSQKYFKVSFEKGEVFLDFENNSISYTDRAGPKAEFKEEILPKVKPYYNMVSAFVDYMNNGKIPPTTMPKVKESTDAVFRVYSKMIEGDPRQYY